MEAFNDLLQLTYRRTLKVFNVTRAALDHFIWTLLIRRDAPPAFALEQPIIVVVQINVLLRYVYSQYENCDILEFPLLHFCT